MRSWGRDGLGRELSRRCLDNLPALVGGAYQEQVGLGEPSPGNTWSTCLACPVQTDRRRSGVGRPPRAELPAAWHRRSSPWRPPTRPPDTAAPSSPPPRSHVARQTAFGGEERSAQ